MYYECDYRYILKIIISINEIKWNEKKIDSRVAINLLISFRIPSQNIKLNLIKIKIFRSYIF